MRRISTTAFRIARRGTFREINRQIALNLVRAKQPISRAELARLLGGHPELGRCVGVGVVVSGMVDLDGRRLKYSPTLGWRDVDLLEPLKAATKLPVVVESSVKACVLAQVWAVRGDVPVDGPVAFVNVSNGVGVGIAIDGKLL